MLKKCIAAGVLILPLLATKKVLASPFRFMPQLPKNYAGISSTECADFNGSWKGSCTVPPTKISITIEHNCREIMANGYLFSIGGVNSAHRTLSDGSTETHTDVFTWEDNSQSLKMNSQLTQTSPSNGNVFYNGYITFTQKDGALHLDGTFTNERGEQAFQKCDLTKD